MEATCKTLGKNEKMRKFGICLDYERNLWKSFCGTLRQAKGNAGRLECLYQIDLMPAEAVAPLNPHMIITYNDNLSRLEEMFRTYAAARKVYNKNNLNVTVADIMQVWKIFKIDKKDNKREKVYEASI